MDNEYIIYCHTNKINNKKYIGQTKQSISRRWGKNGSEYLRKGNDHFKKAILKYGWNNFTHEILFTNLTREQANKKEKELIMLYNSNNQDFGYNMTEGGNSNTLTKEQKELRKQLNYEMWENGIFKEVINTPVYCVELNKDFESALEAQRLTGIDNSSIQKACKKQLNYSGFSPLGQPLHWLYVEDKNNEEILKLRNKKEILKGIKIPVYCIELDKLFSSSKEAGQYCNLSPNNIRACIRGKAKSAGKHPETQIPLHWVERLDLIITNNKISKERWEELIQNG